MIDRAFWKERRVFVTGHTGFKGSWLCLWLHRLGARVTGYALPPPTRPSLFELLGVGELVRSVTGDLRDPERLSAALSAASPEVVIHLAAQPLVRYSYQNPAETYAVNVMGTVQLLEAVRRKGGVRAVLNVTSDKCYENREWLWGYREHDPMGGYDPYSSSKGCSELVTAAYRSSYFPPDDYQRHRTALASARAGNVIGGGDWAADRLIPDCMAALLRGEAVRIRNPRAVRPWQHVLEPLSGYLTLAQGLYREGARHASSWNFGPEEGDAREVGWIVARICSAWPGSAGFVVDEGEHPHEAHYLKLDCSKAKSLLGWRPRWGLESALDRIIEWTLAYKNGADLRELSLAQLEAYQAAGEEAGAGPRAVLDRGGCAGAAAGPTPAPGVPSPPPG